MKKSVKFLALAVAVLMLCMAFASCGKKLSGEYKLDATIAGTGAVTTYDFSGSKVTVTIETKALGQVTGTVELEGKYSIKDDKITFEFESEKDDAKEYAGTFDFKETDDGIKIGLFEYKKV